MGRMHADMLAAVEREGSMVVPFITVEWPDGTRRYSTNSYVAPSGMAAPRRIEDRVRSFSSIDESVSDEQYQLESSAFRLVLSDDDGDIEQRLARGYELVGLPVTFVLGVQGLDPAKWFTAFTGILGDAPHQLEDQRAFELEVRNNDFPLNSFFPKLAIQQYDWPFCHQDALNKWAPIPYGLHDSRTIGGAGAVPLFYVKSDANPFRYLIARGWIRKLFRVLKDGTAVTNYTLVRGIVNGQAYSWIEFTTSQGTSTFTADIEGLDETGDGTGPLIANAAAQYRHALVNWIYNEPERLLSGESPSWRPDSDAPIAASTWDAGAAWLDSLAYCGDHSSMYFGGETQSTGAMAANDFCKSVLASVQFDNLGDLAMVFEDLSEAPASSDLKLTYPRDEVGRSFKPQARRAKQLFSRAIARFGRLVTSDAQLQIECREQKGFDSTETLELPWGSAFA